VNFLTIELDKILSTETVIISYSDIKFIEFNHETGFIRIYFFNKSIDGFLNKSVYSMDVIIRSIQRYDCEPFCLHEAKNIIEGEV
jgi:hypothetical protein